MERDIDIVVAGHACLDVTPTFPDGRERDAAEVLKPGALNEVGPVSLSTGGAVSNTGLSLVRMGLTTRLMGKVGDDAFGRIITDMYAAAGAGEGTRVFPGEASSYSCVVAAPGIDRIFFHFPGCNDTFTADDVDYDLVASARMFHFGYPPLMRRMYEDGGDTLADMMRRARDAGATTSMDMAYPDPLSPAGRADWTAILEKTLPHVDVFVPSIEELLFMLDRDRCDALRADGDVAETAGLDDMRSLARRVLDMGPAALLLKCGSRGLYLRTGDDRDRVGAARPGDVAAWTNREILHAPYAVRVVNATGSGDTAIAGFLGGYLRGASPEDALSVGNVAGAMNVRSQDVVGGLGSYEEMLSERASLSERLDANLPAGETWTFHEASGAFLGPRDRTAI